MSDRAHFNCPIKQLFGNDYIYEIMCGLKFRISSSAFFQVNVRAAERLYECAADFLRLESNDSPVLGAKMKANEGEKKESKLALFG